MGQTTKPLKKRNKEHENWCKPKFKKKLLKSSKKNNGIAYHHHYTGHTIDFTNAQILAEEKNYWRRLIIEGLEIRELGENKANLQAGYEIHECWGPILDKLKI